MPTRPILVKKWYCPVCEYYQDTDPYDASIQHHPDYFPNVELGKCVRGLAFRVGDPRFHNQSMGVEVREDKLQTVSSNDQDDIETIKVFERDANGSPIMVPTDTTRWQLNPMTGKTEELQIFTEKLRELSDTEKKERLQQADQEANEFYSNEFNPNVFDYFTASEINEQHEQIKLDQAAKDLVDTGVQADEKAPSLDEPSLSPSEVSTEADQGTV